MRLTARRRRRQARRGPGRSSSTRTSSSKAGSLFQCRNNNPQYFASLSFIGDLPKGGRAHAIVTLPPPFWHKQNNTYHTCKPFPERPRPQAATARPTRQGRPREPVEPREPREPRGRRRHWRASWATWAAWSSNQKQIQKEKPAKICENM